MAGGLNKKYFHNGGFDQTKISENLPSFIRKHEAAAAPNALALSQRIIQRLAADGRVTDVRYMAYMLATAHHESRETRKFARPVLVKGKPVFDPKTKQPITKDARLWVIFDPINESGRGAGRKYFEPVKVLETPDGALITEKDGDQFVVRRDGTLLRGSSKKMGAVAGGPISKVYADAEGEQHCYFGRGLAQLTWWAGYAVAGGRLGMGLQLLFRPERLLEFDLSYEVMVRGMIEGNWFTVHKCADFLNDATTNYYDARNIINPGDFEHRQLISTLATAYEEILMDARNAAVGLR